MAAEEEAEAEAKAEIDSEVVSTLKKTADRTKKLRVLEEVHTVTENPPELPKKISVKFYDYGIDYFPECPEWGLTTDQLYDYTHIPGRYDAKIVNYARVLEALRESRLPIDRRLAIAAAVAEYGAKERNSHPRSRSCF